jgi:hypothetical protein
MMMMMMMMINLESEVDGRACGAPEMSGISKNGSNR